jgi:hypothetical protein
VTTKAGPHFVHVEDLSHPGLEPYRDQKDAWLRVQCDGGTGLGGFFLAEGEIVARELFASWFKVRSVLVTPTRLLSMRDAIAGLPAGTPVYVAERGVAEAIVGFDMHRGVLALGERGEAPTLASVVGAARCLLVLEGLSNHDNVGSLYRGRRWCWGRGVRTRSIARACGFRWGTCCDCPRRGRGIGPGTCGRSRKLGFGRWR